MRVSAFVAVAVTAAVLAGSAFVPSPSSGAVGAAPDPAPLAAGAFLETFDGSPAAPTPWHPANWDVTVHSRDVSTFDQLETIHAGHGMDCSPPPATHDISAYPDAVFLCRDHVMTAIKAGGYGVIYLTPNQLVDFSAGEAVVKFDVSTLRTSDRDWIDVWVTPFNENVQLAGDIGLVDLNGFPKDAVLIRMDTNNNATIFRGDVITNFDEQLVGSNDGLGLESIVTPSAAVRTPFELHISRTHLKFGIPSLNKWWVDDDITPLAWSTGTVQLGHHSYNPEKDAGCGPPIEVTACAANTWHWDNVGIAPAIPFTILQSDRPRAEQSAPTLTFAGAPADAHLRFTGIGNDLTVSFDAGRTWQTPQLQSFSQLEGAEHFRSYWTPVPAGTQTVQFKGTDWFAGPWLVRNATIWAGVPLPAPVASPSPSPVPPPVPVPTPTPVPAPVPAPGATPIITASALHSAWVDESTYPTVIPGGSTTMTVRFRNTGTATWTIGGPGQVDLAVAGDSLAPSSLGMAAGWLGPNRIATTQERSVGPGQIGTFRFDIRAPAVPGRYRVDLRLVDDGLTWLEDEGVYVVVQADYGFHSAWLSQTPWPTLAASAITTVTLTFQNSGSRAWVRGAAGQEMHLGVAGDDASWAASAIGWPSANRPAIQTEAVVAPGGTGTFTFQLRSPGAPGTYDLPLGLVVDGVTWLEDQGVFVRVVVEP